MPFSKAKYGLKIVTLQVRILPLVKNQKGVTACCREKKAFLSISASLTVEATLGLSIFIFAVVCMILPMKIMNTERKIQGGLESIGEEFSRYAYLKQALESGNSILIPCADEFSKGFCKYLGEGIAVGYAHGKMLEYVDSSAIENLSMLESSIMEDGEWFDLVVNYQVKMPFPVLGLERINRRIRSKRRAWIGKAGKDYDAKGNLDTEKDSVVYIGKDSTRYHKSRSCHYLSNQLQGVNVSQVGQMRNQSGGKYHPCRVCGASTVSGGQVYIMPSGTSYHGQRGCTAIVAYVQTARLSEVEHLGPCSYCSR